MAANVGMEERRNLVYVLEPAVNDGNHHGFATQPDVVQTVALQLADLFCRLAVQVAGHAVTLLEVLVILGLDGCRRDGVGRLPYQLVRLDAGQLADGADAGGVADAYQQGVLPTALSDDGDAVTGYQPYVALGDGQVGGVDGQSLALAPLHAALGEKTGGVGE